MYEPKFEVKFDHASSGLSLTFSDALASASLYTQGGEVSIMFRDEAEARAFFEAVEQEQAARWGDTNTPWRDEKYADIFSKTGSDARRDARTKRNMADEYIAACAICSTPLRLNETCASCLADLRCDP